MKTKPKFKIGDKVKCRMPGYDLLTIMGYSWNGFTYMYDFKRTNMRCGEEYLSPPQIGL